MKRNWPLLLLAVSVAGTYLVTTWHYRVGLFGANGVRDARVQEADGLKWAAPLDMPGLPNLHVVSADLYRGAQPTAQGIAALDRLGIKTIVNLRDHDMDTQIVPSGRIALRHIPLSATHAPDDKAVVEFLKVFSDRRNLPVFVHCQLGADRTGMMCAIYRIAVQGWSKQDAIDEMTQGGFGYHASFEALVDYVRNADLDRLRRQAALPTQPATNP